MNPIELFRLSKQKKQNEEKETTEASVKSKPILLGPYKRINDPKETVFEVDYKRKSQDEVSLLISKKSNPRRRFTSADL